MQCFLSSQHCEQPVTLLVSDHHRLAEVVGVVQQITTFIER